MEAITLSTDLHCDSCVSVVNPILQDDPSIKEYNINLDHPGKLITIQGNGLKTENLISKLEDAGYQAQLFSEDPPLQIPEIKLPKKDADLAFLSITELASLIKMQKISSEELTQFFIKS